MGSGRVDLVGAGPGDPGLLTLRGREALRRADVVIYDRLIDRRLLALAPRRARRIFAGKAAGHHALAQATINALLVAHAGQGHRVVRLKGGDPFVFGRGGEEAEALAARGIPFEVVPGVSSVVAVPAYAGIPLTHRGVASSIAVVTGHETDCKSGPGVQWGRLATAADTLVVVMGLRSLPRLVADLLANGRRPTTPIALIRHGTTAAQQTVAGTLADIVDRAAAARLTPPVLIVIGDVVALRERLAWWTPTATTSPRIRPSRRKQRNQRSVAAPPRRSERRGGMGGHLGAPHSYRHV
jgi:uroporphyrinogen III methyltransferase/synthase